MPAATDEGCRFSGVFGFHDLLQPLHGIDHPLAGLVFSISQSTKSSAARQSSGRDIGRVVVKVLEMVILFEHRSFAATLLILGGVHRARWFSKSNSWAPLSQLLGRSHLYMSRFPTIASADTSDLGCQLTPKDACCHESSSNRLSYECLSTRPDPCSNAKKFAHIAISAEERHP